MNCLKKDTVRRFFIATVFAITSVPVLATEFGISLRIGQPGFYGEIHLGDFYPAPDLIYPEPVVIHTFPAHVRQSPIYLHVPPGHAKQWYRYCSRYSACNRPVYFVRESWYNNVYIPHYHQYNPHQQRYYESQQHRQHDLDRHYLEERHDSHRHYDDHDYREKHRIKDNRRHGFDKHDRGHPGRKNHDRDHR